MNSNFGDDVREGLTRKQKRIPSCYLYDAVGSALFEAITHLPEYGLTRADERIVREHAAEIARLVKGCDTVIELGSGSGRKSRAVLAELDFPQYFPVDVSASALNACVSELSPVANVEPVCADYLDGVERAAAQRNGHPVLAMFLGSTIGNFNRDDGEKFLNELRGLLKPGDALLLGADLVKDTRVLLNAYDDPAGLTAAFNKNLLSRINRELGGNFDARAFSHEARYDGTNHRVEMHLSSLRPQSVRIDGIGLDVRFEQDETIWTESSYKYTLAELRTIARSSGWQPRAVWTDDEWAFAESFWMAA